MGLFKCKCCEVLKAENEHLRKWLDRLMDQKAPDVSRETLGALAEARLAGEDLIYETQE